MASVEAAPHEPEGTLVCSNPECDFGQTGECVDGLEPPECPHTSVVAVEPSDQESELVDDGTVQPPVPAVVPLFGISPLTTRQSNLVSADRGATVILLAGEAEAGKTTLLVSLYELFRQGPIGDVRFAGSQTLLAFEKRAWPGRAASGVERPDTERTSEGVAFLHLLVEHAESHRDVLITDIWGETFENIIEGAMASEDLPIVPRVDVALVMVDGGRIAEVAERQDAISRARLLVGGLTEDDALRPQARLIIALNKTDLLSDEDKTWWSERRKNIAEPADRRLTDVRFIEIAARPAAAPSTPRHLAELLAAALEPTPPRGGLVPEEDDDDHDQRAFWS